MGKAEKDRKKKSFRCVPTRDVIENFKKIAKHFKKLGHTIIASFQAKIDWERLRKRENKKKKIVAMCSFAIPQYKIKQKYQKNSKNLKTPS